MGTKLQGSTTVYMLAKAARYLLDLSATQVLRLGVCIQYVLSV